MTEYQVFDLTAIDQKRDYASGSVSGPFQVSTKNGEKLCRCKMKLAKERIASLKHSIVTADSGEDRTEAIPHNYMYGVPLKDC